MNSIREGPPEMGGLRCIQEGERMTDHITRLELVTLIGAMTKQQRLEMLTSFMETMVEWGTPEDIADFAIDQIRVEGCIELVNVFLEERSARGG
jgi:hypothetical protein